jgi:FkbM family methyltransferase
MRLFLRRFRSLPFFPIRLADGGFPRLAAWWGWLTRAALLAATRRGWPRSGDRVYLPAATFAARLLQSGDVFVDVGAFDGLITIIGAQAVGPTGRIYAFEPTPASCAALRALVQSSKLDHVHVEASAVGAQTGTASFYIPTNPSRAFNATLSMQTHIESVPHVCTVQTLDAFLARQAGPAPALIKIDVEGAELDVLHGAANLLGSSRPPMVIFEASAQNASLFDRTVDDILAYLESFGYHCWILRPPVLLRVTQARSINATEDPEQWTDVAALRPDVHQAAFARLREGLHVQEATGAAASR